MLPGAAPFELMHVGVHLIKVHDGLVTASKMQITEQGKGKSIDPLCMHRAEGDEERVQQSGELGDDPVGVVAEEGDDLGDEARRAPVFLQHLQLLELLVHQTLHGNRDI
jgi:hypothetical protein